MPFGKWADFDACVADIRKQNPDYDEETAKATCGKLKAQLEGKIPWPGTVKPVEGNKVVGQALHPIRTYHPSEWPELRVYLEEELKKSAETLSGKPFGIDHINLLPEPNRITRAWWENDAINYEGEVDDRTADMIRKGEIKGVSVEYAWDILQNVNGVAPKGIEFTSLHFLKNFEPGDPSAYAQLLEAIILKLKEAKQKNTPTTPSKTVAKEQASAEPNEFIFYLVHDPAAFLEERFNTVWVDQTNGIQGVYGYLREQADQPQPMALLFMKANGWTLQKTAEWLRDHPQYVKQTSPTATGIQPAQPGPSQMIGVMKMSKTETKEGSSVEQQGNLKEAEWDTAYVNDLPDSAFAAIEPGGQKDEQGKTTPRSLRHLEHHNAQDNVDEAHVKAALQRLNQTKISDALKAEAKKHLCGHAKQMDFVSEVCGEEPPKAEESKPVASPPKPMLPEALITPTSPQTELVIPVRKIEDVMPTLQAERSMTGGAQHFVREIKRLIYEAKETKK